MFDRITRWLAYAVFVLILAILTLAFYIVWTGVLRPQPPRTYIERDLSRLESVVEAKPQVAEGWRDYLRTLTAAGMYSKAHRVADEARSVLASDSATIDIEEARIYLAEADVETARTTVDTAISSQEDALDRKLAELNAQGIRVERSYIQGGETLLEAYILKAQILSVLEEWEDAAAAYSQSLEMSPAMADVLVARGFVYLKLEDTSKAKKDFDRALQFDPELETAKAGLKEIGQ